ncbi:hypothetical protein PFISCL1PPCAC_17838, partial [Pristionchus fissidentatus]
LIICRILTSSVSIILLCCMECYRNKFPAHKSMKMLMNWHGLWTFILCVSTLIDNSITVHTHWTASNASDILLTSEQCLPRRLIGAIALYGSVASMMAMALERRAASAHLATYDSTGRWHGPIYVVLHLIFTLGSGWMVWASYGYPSKTPHCTIVTPRGITELNIINVQYYI